MIWIERETSLGKDKSGAQKGSSSAKVRRSSNLSKQPERKLRHMLKRNQIEDARKWAEVHVATSLFKKLLAEREER